MTLDETIRRARQLTCTPAPCDSCDYQHDAGRWNWSQDIPVPAGQLVDWLVELRELRACFTFAPPSNVVLCRFCDDGSPQSQGQMRLMSTSIVADLIADRVARGLPPVCNHTQLRAMIREIVTDTIEEQMGKVDQ